MIHTLLAGIRDGPFVPRLVTQRDSELTDAARADGIAVDVVPLPPALEVFGGELARAAAMLRPAAIAGLFEYDRAFARFLECVRPSVVWASNLRTLLTVAAACRRARVPLVWNIWLGQRSRGSIALLNEAGIRLADRIVTEYRAQAVEIFRPAQLARARPKVRTVHTGHAIIAPPPRAMRRHDDAFVVGTLGALSPRKNPRAFLELAARVREMIPTARFVLGGDVPSAAPARFEESLRDYAAESGLSGCLEWTGWVDDPRAFLARLDVYVQTSRAEGLPGAVREAMAMAIPVVATDVGGTSEAVVPGETGFLAPPSDVASLADATLRLARDPALAARLGRAGRARFEARFAVEPFLRGTLAVLAELVPGVSDWSPPQDARASHSEIALSCSRPSECPASNVRSSTSTPAAARSS